MNRIVLSWSLVIAVLAGHVACKPEAEALGGMLVPPALHQDVEHEAVLVDHPPQPVLLAGASMPFMILKKIRQNSGRPALLKHMPTCSLLIQASYPCDDTWLRTW